jgi:hypothetical protein
MITTILTLPIASMLFCSLWAINGLSLNRRRDADTARSALKRPAPYGEGRQ